MEGRGFRSDYVDLAAVLMVIVGAVETEPEPEAEL